jgi:uncharacterized membrane protein
MNKTRLEAFSDAVIAIIMTIMVLELKVPHTADFEGLKPLVPIFGAYLLSFVYLGIYWNNHHHMLQATRKVNGQILWANLLLLFWLSLIPFATAWAGENHFAPVPMATYGFVLLMCALSYSVLQGRIVKHEDGENEMLARAVGKDYKGKLSLLFYLVGIPVSLLSPWIAGALYVGVALVWLIPDRRIERTLH